MAKKYRIERVLLGPDNECHELYVKDGWFGGWKFITSKRTNQDAIVAMKKIITYPIITNATEYNHKGFDMD